MCVHVLVRVCVCLPVCEGACFLERECVTVRACMRTCVFVCVRVCACVCVCECECVWVCVLSVRVCTCGGREGKIRLGKPARFLCQRGVRGMSSTCT